MRRAGAAGGSGPLTVEVDVAVAVQEQVQVQGTVYERDGETPCFVLARCPECGGGIDGRTTLCEDWRDPARRLGCPHCGLWLVRNPRRRVHWVPLLPSLFLLMTVAVGLHQMVRILVPSGWALGLQGLLFFLVIVASMVLLRRWVRYIGPPLLPADGERAEIGKSEPA